MTKREDEKNTLKKANRKNKKNTRRKDTQKMEE